MTSRMCASWYVGSDHLLARPPWPVVLGLFGPYHKYHGFCTHEPPVPGPAVIMHCSNEVKAQLLAPLLPEYTHTPRPIGFGAARAGVDRGQGAKGEQDHGGAHRLHGASPAVDPSDSIRRPYSKIMTVHTTPRRSKGCASRAERARV